MRNKLEMFRPENIFLVHGHGETTKYEKLKQTPFGPLVFEFQRFNVPPLVFTASSRELGLNTPPSSELIQGIQQDAFVTRLPIPDYRGTYGDYTTSLRTLGQSLFDVVVPSRGDSVLEDMWMILESTSPTGSLPKQIHTHGPMTKTYKNQPVNLQKKDYFLFSHPDDQIELNTLTSLTNRLTKVPANPLFSYRKGYMISGIIPVNELRQADRNVFSFDVLVPTSFFSKKLNSWNANPTEMSDDMCRQWRDFVMNRRIINNHAEVTSIVATDDRHFCRQYIDKLKDLFRRIYFWSTKYNTLDEFYSHSIAKFEMRLKSKNIANWIANIRPNEPKLIVFYHCRSINPVVSGLANWFNNDYMNAASRIEAKRRKPLLARTFSTSAAMPGGTRKRTKSYKKQTRKNRG